MVGVYGGGPLCVCPNNVGSLLACGDDSCGVPAGPPTVTIPVTTGGCYTIQVGGWMGTVGTGNIELSMTCQQPNAPTPEPAGVDKNRYLLVNPSADPQSTAMRVTLTDLDGFKGSASAPSKTRAQLQPSRA